MRPAILATLLTGALFAILPLSVHAQSNSQSAQAQVNRALPASPNSARTQIRQNLTASRTASGGSQQVVLGNCKTVGGRSCSATGFPIVEDHNLVGNSRTVGGDLSYTQRAGAEDHNAVGNSKTVGGN